MIKRGLINWIRTKIRKRMYFKRKNLPLSLLTISDYLLLKSNISAKLWSKSKGRLSTQLTTMTLKSILKTDSMSFRTRTSKLSVRKKTWLKMSYCLLKNSKTSKMLKNSTTSGLSKQLTQFIFTACGIYKLSPAPSEKESTVLVGNSLLFKFIPPLLCWEACAQLWSGSKKASWWSTTLTETESTQPKRTLLITLVWVQECWQETSQPFHWTTEM